MENNVKIKYLSLLLGSLMLWITPLFADSSFTLKGPMGWEAINDATQLPAKVKVVYVSSGKWLLTPSINLAIESSPLTLTEYVNEATAYHKKTADTQITTLGTIKTKAGKAELLQIDRKTGWGNVRFIQAILKVEEQACVVTATCLQEDFGHVSRAIFQTIESLDANEKKY